MCDSQRLIATLILCSAAPMCSYGRLDTDSSGLPPVNDVVITLLGADSAEGALRVRYVIRNGSGHDIWLCDSMSVQVIDCEVCWSEEARAFVVRRRSNVERWFGFRNPPLSRYVCLRKGQERSESLWVPLPIQPRPIVGNPIVPKNIDYVDRIVLEIGYYSEISPEMLDPLIREERTHTREEFFAYHNTGAAFGGERVLHLAVGGLRLPCKGDSRTVQPPGLSNCTRIDISCEPSVLSYFFPYTDWQDFLDSSEKKLLQSIRMITVDDPKSLKTLAEQMRRGVYQPLMAKGPHAHLVCYRDGKQVVSFDLYHDVAVADKKGFFYYGGTNEGTIPDLEQITPQVRSFALRVRCVDHLNDLNSALRSYVARKAAYPTSATWCDDVVQDADAQGYVVDDSILKPFTCPAVSEGRCHYAMNPNCAPKSPQKTVLLFETKAGWNHHGGPELFTFDNHDPKGGLVLLNDGTVKFIRTEEELKQLRWK